MRGSSRISTREAATPSSMAGALSSQTTASERKGHGLTRRGLDCSSEGARTRPEKGCALGMAPSRPEPEPDRPPRQREGSSSMSACSRDTVASTGGLPRQLPRSVSTLCIESTRRKSSVSSPSLGQVRSG